MQLKQIMTRLQNSVKAESIMHVKDSVSHDHVNLAWNNVRNSIANSVFKTIVDPLYISLREK